MENEKIIYRNGYIGFIVTASDDCAVCGAEVNFYRSKFKPPKKVFSICWLDLREMLPELVRFVEAQTVKDESGSAFVEARSGERL